MSAIFYISTAKLDTGGYITSRQAREMIDNGNILGSHTHTHPRLLIKGIPQIIEELEVSAQVLQKLHGARPTHFAPPGGLYNEDFNVLPQKQDTGHFGRWIGGITVILK